jgi:hypothetical protein
MTCVIDSGMMAETRVVSGLGSIIVDKVRPFPDPVQAPIEAPTYGCTSGPIQGPLET